MKMGTVRSPSRYDAHSALFYSSGHDMEFALAPTKLNHHLAGPIPSSGRRPLTAYQMPPPHIVKALQRGFLAFQAGDLGEAEAAFKKALSKDERQFDALHMLAVIHAQRGNYAEGIRLISRALAINPSFAEAHVNLGRMQAETGDFHAAAVSCRRALSLNPRLPVAHSNLSAVLRTLGLKEEALSHSAAAVTMAPNYGDAWCNHGNIL